MPRRNYNGAQKGMAIRMNIRKIKADGVSEKELLAALKARSTAVDKQVTEVVTQIIEDVKASGDRAVRAYTEKFDGKLPPYIEVPREEINDALTNADSEFVDALLNAMENISDFHNRQKQQGFVNTMPNGVMVGQRVRGLSPPITLPVSSGRPPQASINCFIGVPIRARKLEGFATDFPVTVITRSNNGLFFCTAS